MTHRPIPRYPLDPPSDRNCSQSRFMLGGPAWLGQDLDTEHRNEARCSAKTDSRPGSGTRCAQAIHAPHCARHSTTAIIHSVTDKWRGMAAVVRAFPEHG